MFGYLQLVIMPVNDFFFNLQGVHHIKNSRIYSHRCLSEPVLQRRHSKLCDGGTITLTPLETSEECHGAKCEGGHGSWVTFLQLSHSKGQAAMALGA